MKLIKGIVYFLVFLVALNCISCNNPRYGEPVKEPAYLLSSFNVFWSYWNEKVKLSRNFISFDENEKGISKAVFLEKITSGEYLPLRLTSTDSLDYYRLYKLNNQVGDDITSAIKICGNNFYQKYKLVDKALPDFNFTDLKGTVYNKESCKGKIVVLNFWFIHCGNCVAEMPLLNQLVNSYKNQPDIVFVSLANDSPTELKKFLEKTSFNYAVVANMKPYLQNTLNVPGFPMHVIINKNGIVASVPEDYKELEIELRKETVM
jgi:thiol-disulfide isomerase/thioredoxin